MSGINLLDTAEGYGTYTGESELILGHALIKTIPELGILRKDVVLTAKIFHGGKGINDKGLSRKHILESMEASLLRLATPYVDIVYCHRFDPTTPLKETVRAMSDLVQMHTALGIKL